jgi:hypothetical protein
MGNAVPLGRHDLPLPVQSRAQRADATVRVSGFCAASGHSGAGVIVSSSQATPRILRDSHRSRFDSARTASLKQRNISKRISAAMKSKRLASAGSSLISWINCLSAESFCSIGLTLPLLLIKPEAKQDTDQFIDSVTSVRIFQLLYLYKMTKLRQSPSTQRYEAATRPRQLRVGAARLRTVRLSGFRLANGQAAQFRRCGGFLEWASC